MCRVPSATRANLPIRYAFSVVSDAPPYTATASGPYFSCISRSRRAVKSSASSHAAARKPSGGAHQRIEQPVRMVRLQITLHALGAKHPAVEREVLPRLEADHAVLANLELNAALLAAEAAVRLHQLLGAVARLVLPAAGRRVVQVRAVAFEPSPRAAAAV